MYPHDDSVADFSCSVTSLEAAKYGNVKAPNLRPEGIAVNPQNFGSLDLVAACQSKAHGNQRTLHFAQRAVVETGLRKTPAQLLNLARQITLDERAQRLIRLFAARGL